MSERPERFTRDELEQIHAERPIKAYASVAGEALLLMEERDAARAICPCFGSCFGPTAQEGSWAALVADRGARLDAAEAKVARLREALARLVDAIEDGGHAWRFDHWLEPGAALADTENDEGETG